jgi:hypothetical protein
VHEIQLSKDQSNITNKIRRKINEMFDSLFRKLRFKQIVSCSPRGKLINGNLNKSVDYVSFFGKSRDSSIQPSLPFIAAIFFFFRS